MELLNKEIEKYIIENSDDEDLILKELFRETNLKVLNPRMISGYIQGKFLEFVSKMIKPEYILEIGTFTGYSVIYLSKGLKEKGVLHTIEINDELAEFPKKYIQKLNLEDKIIFHYGDALEIINKLNFEFDLVFIDGDKRQYIEYYNAVFDKVKNGGFIIADNVLWDGKIIDEKANDDFTNHLRKFNSLLKSDDRIEKFILPLRDGLMLMRKK